MTINTAFQESVKSMVILLNVHCLNVHLCSLWRYLMVSVGNKMHPYCSVLKQKRKEQSHCCYCTEDSDHLSETFWAKNLREDDNSFFYKSKISPFMLKHLWEGWRSSNLPKSRIHSLPNTKGKKKLDKHLSLETRLGIRISEQLWIKRQDPWGGWNTSPESVRDQNINGKWCSDLQSL